MRVFTKEELKQYKGAGKPTYIAYKGKVYDISESPLWEGGSHLDEHYAGEDLTEAMENAPHGAEVVERFPVVGELS